MSRGLPNPQSQFNPYYQWLAIPLRDQPAHHYRLLGIPLFETDGQIIRAAADRRMTYIRQYQLGQHSALSQQLLDEVAEARSCLLDLESRQAYDDALSARLGGRRRLSRDMRSSAGSSGPTGAMTDATAFDPYYHWLGIHPEDQPHQHYQLLGLERFESDAQIIRAAAEQQLTYVNKYSTGRYAEHARRLIDDLREAQACLLSPAMKSGYDDGLRASLRATPAAPTVSVPAAVAKSVTAATIRPRRSWRPLQWLSAHGKVIGYTIASALVAVGVLLVVMLSAPDPNFAVEERYLNVQPAPVVAVGGPAMAANREPAPSGLVDVRHANTAPKTKGDSAAAPVAPVAPAPAVEHAVHDVASANSPAPEPQPEQPEMPAENAGDDAGAPTAEPASVAAADDAASPQEMPEKDATPEAAPQSVESETTRPLKPGLPVNLLQQIDLKRDMIAGKWKFDKGVLVSPLNAFHSRVQIPTSVPAAYTLQAIVERSRGSSRLANRTLAFGLVVGDAQYLVTIDGSTAGGMQFSEGKPSVILCTVRPEGVRVTFDGRKVVEWSGDSERLSIPPLWETPDKQSLFIGSDCGYRFRSLTLRPLE